MASKRGSQRGGSSRSWNPADHPRDPIGRFSVVGSSFRRQMESNQRRFAARDAEAKRGDADPPGWNREEWGSPNNYGVSRSDADQADNRFNYEYEEDGGWDNPTDHGARIDQFDWRGLDPQYPEADLDGFINGTTKIDYSTADDLGDLGEMNQGVIRAQLIDAQSNEPTSTMVVLKSALTEEEADAEFLATEVGHVIGAPTPLIKQNPLDRRELIMEGVPGSMGAEADIPTPLHWTREEVANYRNGGARLAILDQITGNRDRHSGNWILTDNGTPVGIDNGLAFGGYDEPHRSVQEVRHIQRNFMKTFDYNGGVSNWVEWSDRVPDSELYEWRRELTEIRPLFDSRGRGPWHDAMMINLDFLIREREDDR